MSFLENHLYSASQKGDADQVKEMLAATPSLDINWHNPASVRVDGVLQSLACVPAV
jgi:hypothetical protein